MPAARVAGLSPSLPSHRPRADAAWWQGEADSTKGALRVRLAPLPHRPGTIEAVTGLCAPCSLPGAFLESLQATGDRAASLAHLARYTRSRLFSLARSFAAARSRGHRHPPRFREESLSSLDRRRLARFHAALPLLRVAPTLPWAGAEKTACLFEVDVPALLTSLGLPASGITGQAMEAVRRRREVLDALEASALGFAVQADAPELALAIDGAFEALLACAVAAWWSRGPRTVTAGEAWCPLPTRGAP